MAVTPSAGYPGRMAELTGEMTRDATSQAAGGAARRARGRSASPPGWSPARSVDSEAESAARDFGEAWEERDYGGDVADAHAGRTRRRRRRRSSARPTTRRCGTATATRIEWTTHARKGTDVSVDVERAARASSARSTEHRMKLPVEDGRIDWSPHLVFPGLSEGEELSRETTAPRASEDPRARRQHARRGPGVGASLAARHGRRRDRRRPDGADDRGRARALYARGFEADTPGRRLRARANPRGAGRRDARRASCAPGPASWPAPRPQPAEPVRTTIDVGRPGGRRDRAGGPLRRDRGARREDAAPIRGLAGIAFSAPQPPGSTFKIITTTAALEEKLVKPSDGVPDRDARDHRRGRARERERRVVRRQLRGQLRPLVQLRVRAARGEDRGREAGRDGRALRLQRGPRGRRRGAEHAARQRTTSPLRSSWARPRSGRAACSRRRCELAVDGADGRVGRRPAHADGRPRRARPSRSARDVARGRADPRAS